MFQYLNHLQLFVDDKLHLWRAYGDVAYTEQHLKTTHNAIEFTQILFALYFALRVFVKVVPCCLYDTIFLLIQSLLHVSLS